MNLNIKKSKRKNKTYDVLDSNKKVFTVTWLFKI